MASKNFYLLFFFWVLQEYEFEIIWNGCTWSYSPTSHTPVFPTQLQHHRANAMAYRVVCVCVVPFLVTPWGPSLCARSSRSLVHVPACKHWTEQFNASWLWSPGSDDSSDEPVAHRYLWQPHTRKQNNACISIYFYYIYLSSLAQKPGRFQDAEMHKYVVISAQPRT